MGGTQISLIQEYGTKIKYLAERKAKSNPSTDDAGGGILPFKWRNLLLHTRELWLGNTRH